MTGDRHALRVLTPRLELRLPTEDELYALADVARAGVHPPERMPFYVPWTDRAHLPEFPDAFVAYHQARVDSLELGVFFEDGPVGVQALRIEAGVVDTGSWLGARWQNRGLGVEMRCGALELAFRGLGVEAATSGAFADNPQSRRVSEKLGYREVGTRTVAPRGTPVVEHLYRLDRADWTSPVRVELVDVEAFRNRSGPPL